MRRLSLIPTFEATVTPDPQEHFCLVSCKGPEPFTLSQGKRQQASFLYEGLWHVQGLLTDTEEAVTLATDRLFLDLIIQLPKGGQA